MNYLWLFPVPRGAYSVPLQSRPSVVSVTFVMSQGNRKKKKGCLMNMNRPSIPQWKSKKQASSLVAIGRMHQPTILTMRGTTYWSFAHQPNAYQPVHYAYACLCSQQPMEGAGHTVDSPSPPSRGTIHSAGGRGVLPSVTPPRGSACLERGEIRINICKNWGLNIPRRLTYLQ